MSRIYFHSPSGTSEVRGSERAHMGALLSDLTAGALGVGGPFSLETLLPLAPPRLRRDDYQGFGSALRFAQDFRTWLAVGGEGGFTTPRGQLDAFSVVLNTGLALGGNPLRLFARLHGQCELHAWVAAENRAWLADIVEDGLRCGIMRRDQGWEALCGFLRARSDEAVVTSYSVCDGFPNAALAGRSDDADVDDWYNLPAAERWASAFAGLGSGLEMRPDHWVFPDYHFGHGETAFSLRWCGAPAPEGEAQAPGAGLGEGCS